LRQPRNGLIKLFTLLFDCSIFRLQQLVARQQFGILLRDFVKLPRMQVFRVKVNLRSDFDPGVIHRGNPTVEVARNE
jgi:hypothetical protein